MNSRIIDPPADGLAQQARSLLSAAAVRRNAQRLMALALDGALEDWAVHVECLPATADFVAKVVRERYPRLDPPWHARWRHFVFAGHDLWREIVAGTPWDSAAAKARAAFDLAITSVLLDAGAGSAWSYRDTASGLQASRSEGLALASLRWFANGGLSARAHEPLRADAAVLRQLDAATLTAAFQVEETNPLPGLAGRVSLLNRLGEHLQQRPDLFALADSPRPGGLFDALVQRADGAPLPAAAILDMILEALGPIWTHRPSLGGVPLGDCWPHPALRGAAPADGYVPLHKLSQWLAYSLIEPLAEAGVAVCDIGELTGLAEYRNGGLFVDSGVLVPRDATAGAIHHPVDHPFIVGWRGLTVALLDRLAPLVRRSLGVGPDDFPLARLLEGGTWAAGRIIARQLRPDGRPPLQISSDGTVF